MNSAPPGRTRVSARAFGMALTPPRRHGDCTCLFCSMFRSQHLIRRAVFISFVPPVLLAIVWWANRQMTQEVHEGATSVVGALLLLATGFTVLTLVALWSPSRRLSHRLWPRTQSWPPPL